MQKALVHFKGLYGDNPHSLLPNFIHFEALETRSKIYDWEIKEHLHTDLFQVFLIKSGEGLLVSEQKEWTLTGPCIATIPAHSLHGFVFQPNINGEVLTFSDSFLEGLLKKSQQAVFDDEALRVLTSIPSWSCYYKRGVPHPIVYYFVVIFDENRRKKYAKP